MKSVIFLSAVCGDDEQADEWLENMARVLSSRVLAPRHSIPKSTALRELLWDYQETEFKLIVRVNRVTFQYLVSEIQENKVTRSNIGVHEPKQK